MTDQARDEHEYGKVRRLKYEAQNFGRDMKHADFDAYVSLRYLQHAEPDERRATDIANKHGKCCGPAKQVKGELRSNSLYRGRIKFVWQGLGAEI